MRPASFSWSWGLDMKCSQYGAENIDSCEYCQACGTPLRRPGSIQAYSRAHLFLLSKFLRQKRVENLSERADWAALLGESPQAAIQRFRDKGLIEVVPLEEQLAATLQVPELKTMLQIRGLADIGKKSDLVARLIKADRREMAKRIENVTLLRCSERGRMVVEEFLASEQQRRSEAERQAWEDLSAHRFRNACLIAAAYHRDQLMPRGPDVDWKHYNPTRDTATLESIFRVPPGILSSLDDDALQFLRMAASMMHLWGEQNPARWLPTDFDTGSNLDREDAACMVLSAARRKDELENYRRSGVVIMVEIFPTKDDRVCENCRRATGTRYPLNWVPELPNPYCTSPLGCRCTYRPLASSRTAPH